MAKTFLEKHHNTIIATAITISMAAAIPSIVWVHNAYADDRYLLKEDALRVQINQIDNRLFEISQEIIFAETDQDKNKAESMEGYYERQKEALQELLDED